MVNRQVYKVAIHLINEYPNILLKTEQKNEIFSHIKTVNLKCLLAFNFDYVAKTFVEKFMPYTFELWAGFSFQDWSEVAEKITHAGIGMTNFLAFLLSEGYSDEELRNLPNLSSEKRQMIKEILDEGKWLNFHKYDKI